MLKQIKYFVAVVDNNSFTEAAEQCYISQSAISQQIQSLENELGIKLLQRKNRRFSMTPAGEYFYIHGKVILEEIENLRRETVKIGQEKGRQLQIGYLKCYSGMELHQAVAEFSLRYPEVSINITHGTHEELYDLLRLGGVDLIVSDQRRAFSNEYINLQLLPCVCYAELSIYNKLSVRDYVTLEDLKQTPCILISSKEQQNIEQNYYKNTLGFRGSFLFAESLEEGRLMVVGNRGFLPIESVGPLPPESLSIRRVPVYRDGKQLLRNYCAFWRKKQTNRDIEEFAKILCDLIDCNS